MFTEAVGVAWKEKLTVHAAALGHEEEAAELMAAYETRAREVGAALPDGQTDSIVRLVPGEIRLYAKASFIGTVLEDARYRPAAGAEHRRVRRGGLPGADRQGRR